MTISYISSSVGWAASTPDITVTAPASIQDDDLLLAFYSNSYQSGVDDGTPVTLSGFTKINDVFAGSGTDITAACFWKIASSETGNYDMSADVVGGGTQRTTGAIIVLRGVDTTTPLDVAFVEANHWDKAINSATPTPKPITTDTDNAWVVLWGCTLFSHVSACNPVSGYDERVEQVVNNGNVEICTKLIPTASTTETPGAFPHTDIDSSNETGMYTLAIKEASAGGSVVPSLSQGYSRYTGKLT